MSTQNIDLTWHILKSRNMCMTEAVPKGEWWIVLALSIFLSISLSACVTHWVSCWWRWGGCVCPCMLFMCKGLMYLMSHSWLHYCYTATVYMSEWFVYSLSKDQFPLCVRITVAEYFQGWNCLSEHLRELLNVLFTQH